MAINKVVYGNQTLIDLTDSTLTSSDEIVEGVTAYDRSGNLLTGTADYMDKVDNPSADKILIDDGNGQAQDSSVSIIDVALMSDVNSKQNLISNPTADKILVDSSTGQAVESSVSISDVATTDSIKNGKLTIQKNGTNVAEFTANQSNNVTANITMAAVAASGSYNDLSDKPTIPAAVAVKGNAESSYRTGNVNLTPTNIGAVAIDGGYVKYKLADGSDTFAAFRQGGNLSSGTAVLGVYTYNASNSSYKSTVGILVNSDGSRNFAILDDLSYNSGDTFTNTLGTTNYIMCSGVMASSSIVRFTIPIDKPISASSISFSTLNLTVYVAGSRIVNNINVATNSSYTGKTYQINNGGITVQFTLPSSITATAFEPVSVAIGNMTGSFS